VISKNTLKRAWAIDPSGVRRLARFAHAERWGTHRDFSASTFGEVLAALAGLGVTPNYRSTGYY
jgi:hypothetical protein